ncbi:MAG: HAMP domain-containing protein, partial [Anaerolineae bacterium]|nr:HAMP domain-containing protein [Anaerolineae bacterium]
MLKMINSWQWLRMLRVRIVLWTVALEAILLIVFAILLVSILQNIQNQQINETLRLSAAQMNAVVDVRGTTFDVPSQDVADIQSRGVIVWIVAPDGSLGATVGQAERFPIPTMIPAEGSISDLDLAQGELVRVLVEPLREGNTSFGTLILALPLGAEFQIIKFVRWSLFFTIPIVLILSIVGGFFLASRALGPIKGIAATARQITATDLNKRLQLDLPDDEVGQLANTFNAMLDRIEDAFQRERQFTSDASHELR